MRNTMTRNRLTILSLCLLSAVGSFLGIDLSPGPVIFVQPPVEPMADLSDSWSYPWSRVPAVHLPASSSNASMPRLVSLRALKRDGLTYFLLEWHDDSPDMSFFGTMDQGWLDKEREMAPESALMRDDVRLVLLDAPVDESAESEATAGYWQWKSQWQFDRSLLAKLRAEIGVPYSDYTILNHDGAFPARYLDNTNAIREPGESGNWVHSEYKTVYSPARITPMKAIGNSKFARWRVLFTLDREQMSRLAGKINFYVSLANGGYGEGRKFRCLSVHARLVSGVSP